MHPVLDVNPRVNLDVLSTDSQVRVNLAHGYVQGAQHLAAGGAGSPIALARDGYILNSRVGGPYQSVSDDLQHVRHTWASSDGQYPAPASNPADIWLSNPYAPRSWAQEYNEYGRSVGSPVALPEGSIVLGQIGQTLVLQSAPPAQSLELWSMTDQQLISTLGSWDQVATSPNLLAVASSNTLRIASSDGSVSQTFTGPSGDWATSMAFAPNGTELAVVWAPRPGSPYTSSRRTVDAHSNLALINAITRSSSLVPRSQGAVGPVAWIPDGSRLFFGQATRNGTSVGIATIAVGGTEPIHLKIPGVTLPLDLGSAIGSLITWTAP
jgi:hypothetical protein